MKTVIIYHSKTGFTKRYAEWIADELSADIFPYSKRDKAKLNEYDTIIFGGGFHAGRISKLKWFKKKAKSLKDKRLIVFATGASPEETEDCKKALELNIPKSEQEYIKVYYFQSGLSYERMGFMARLMMKMFRAILKKQDENSDAYKMVSTSFDVCDKGKITSLVNMCAVRVLDSKTQPEVYI